MAHRKFSGASWGDVFHEIAEWAYAHQRSEDYRVANLPKETLPGDDWTLLNSIVLDVSPDDLTEVRLDSFGSQELAQDLETPAVVGQHADVGPVALVARASMGHRVQPQLLHRTSSTAEVACTRSFAINAGQ